MSDKASINLDGTSYDLPVIVGTENEKAVDISKLRDLSGFITLDPGYKNTGATKSAITFLDGEKGILRYRGYPIEQLAEKSTFLEVAYLLIYGELPKKEVLEKFRADIKKQMMIHEDMKNFFAGFPSKSHPMGQLSCLVGALSAFYPESLNPNLTDEEEDQTIINLLAKMPTIVSWIQKKSLGHPVVYPKNNLGYIDNFLNMLFGEVNDEKTFDPVVIDAMHKLLILHADHEQNCSTSTVRIVGSSNANLYASVASGINALWGPLHGGANQAVIEMLEAIKNDGGDAEKYLAKAKDKNDPFRLMGFGHRVYKNFDPRAKIIKKACDDILEKLGVQDPVLDIAKRLEEAALNDQYFIDRKLYPNVDFYSGIIYRALGFKADMFTVLFALGRLPGWIAQWKEMRENKEPIGRPRQVYVGHTERDYVEFSNR
ncbi:MULTISPECIES: citrate synthase [Sphingobacterium]|jgi:citrate synthase|uniref:Citrate synthase n=1 Tax=Sphingobacterium multivorum TaxID=28454 RepID=A0A2X2KY80_SPHMU|nr:MULTISPECIES: citrate synthase [Sphingobacterium]HAE68359.1 citrate synthase [Sphingobacterium sp.]KKO92187.1 type II citrate synthase [Sphingobacterium sp. Ag1]MDF2852074.1 citrate (Si)-synthase [Sphingobacterium multivorum]OFV20491.1 citrate (Si)-synthase [Sphingobacterium sp. HMSC13C05]OJZ08606.1 MAG: citrate (Si)-synthase [Sphingobacterium sp. 40-24]